MPFFRQIAVWMLLASYLCANTVASLWHDHQDHHTCQNHERRGNHAPVEPTDCPAGCSTGHNEDGHHEDGNGQRDPHHCVVCEFLALAPLAAPQAALVSSGEVLPEFVVLHVVPVPGTTVETHLARGPPAA